MTETAILKTALEGLQADRTESRAMMQYARELQEIWDNALMNAARNNLGAMESDIYMERDKIRKILQDHPEMTLIGPGCAAHGGGHGPKGQKPALERG